MRVIVVRIGCISINGINIIGFMIIGRLNRIGLLIWKMLDGSVSFVI